MRDSARFLKDRNLARRSKAVNLTLAALMVLFVLGCSAPMTSSVAPSSPGMAESAAFAPQEGAMAQSDNSALGAGDTTSALLNRRLIARATMDMVVADTGATVDEVERLLGEMGGFIANANLRGDSSGDASQQVGYLTLRVPAENLEPMMTALEGLAIRVRNRTINREDVTDQYTDIEARLRTLRATEEELFAMLEEVRERPDATPEDILAVHARLMEIRGQIEQTQGQQNMYDNLIALSTIELSIVPDSSAAPVIEEGWRPGAAVRDATRALVNSLQWLGDFAIWLVIYALPIFVLILAPIVAVFWILRWFFRKISKPRRVKEEGSQVAQATSANATPASLPKQPDAGKGQTEERP